MASSSNSKRPFCSSSSSNSKWRYDVFLSFRGEDTRNNFTSHLYKDLDKANIKTFKDDEELRKGGEIAPELLKAIEESRIAIIVFSKTYAHSKWCLDELVKIMECQKEKGQIVYPVFYHVRPCEVRNQYGTYGEEFKKHESNADEEKKKKIVEWRTALRKAGDLSGFSLRDRSEAEFIEEIIGEIRRLIPKWVHVGENIVGMDEKLKEVKLLIDAQSNKVSMVGIYGIGGIGKTTIAKVVYNDMLDQFKCHSFLVVLGSFLYQRGVDEWESTLHKLKTTPFKDIQNVLQISYDGLDDICKKLFLDIACFFKDHNKEFVTSILEGCDLHPKIGLKVLDERCLISILGGTIRMHDLLQEMGWAIVRQKYPKHLGKWSRLWEYEDIKSVFTKNMGTKNIEGIFINCTKAKPIQFTAEAFKKMNRLRLLKVEEDMVQLSQDFELPCHDLVYFHWVAYPLESLPSNFHADNLVELNLQYSNIKHLWEGNMPAKKLKVINLRHSKHLVDISSISSAPNLEILILEGCIRLESLPRNLHTLECLQTLSCYGCSKMKSFPEIKGNMGSLRELDLSETDIIEVPSSIRHLHGLNTLKLSDCLNLVSLQDGICSLSSLQTLLMDGSSELKAFLDINIGSLKALEWLDLSYCENLESLPDSICSLTSLQTLLLNGCSKLKAFPYINIGSLKALELLALSYCENLESLPDSICNLTSLQTLMLKECSKLKGFPDINIGSLKALKLLDLSYCENLESLPDSICGLTSLQTLLLNGCSKLKAFPDINIANLKALELLDFSYCENFGSLLDRICSLTSLQTLLLKKCSKLKAFPDINIGSLKALKLLDLLYCENLKNLPDSICSLISLQTLLLNECSKLKAFPDINIGSLKALELLDLSYCKNLESLPDSICSLTSLQTLLLNGCSKLKAFPDINIGSLKALNLLDLSYCINLESLPHSICSLTSLQTLLLNGCSKLKAFPCINIGSLKALKLLNLSYCENLESLPDSICNLTSLQTLLLNGCSKLKAFPDINIGCLKALELLDFSYCKNLESLPHSICSLTSLQTLLLNGCSKLKAFPDINVGSLKALELLDLSYCENLESLPHSICSLTSLQTLLLNGCSKLKDFPDINIGSLKVLELLDLSYCESLESLPDSICSLTSLQTLWLNGCSKLKVFPDINIGSLKALELLDLSCCKKLESLPMSICNLSSLKTLRIKDCPKLKGILKMNLGVDLCSSRSLNLTCHISNSGVIWDNDCFSSLKALNPWCPLSSVVELSVRNSNLMEQDILSASFRLSSLQILSLRNFPLMVGGILDDIFHLSSLVELSLSECNLMEVGTLHYVWNLSSLLRLYLRNCNLMEGEIPNHIWHLSSLEELYLDGNHFSSLPAGISRLTNLRVLDLSHCKNLQQIPELPSSLRFLDAHCSGGISSSPSPLPIHSMVNCFKPEIPVPRIHAGCTFFVGNGISIVVPRSSGILEWIRYQSMGGYKVTIELPPNWYENKELLGFALCCVYESNNGFVFESLYESTDTSDNEPDNGSAYESQHESADTSNNEPDNGSAYKSADTSDNEPDNGSAYESQNESADTSNNEPTNGSAYESENETAHTSDNEEPVEFYCNLSIRGNNQSTVVDSFKLGSYCANDGASDIVWVIFYPKVAFKEAIKELYRSNQWTHFMASFGGFRRVEQCMIRLIYAED